MSVPIFTIGHSNRSWAEFLTLLREPQVESLLDIRKIPRSRTNPQFNMDTLPEALAPFDISYEHVASLGGLRGKSQKLPPEVNAFWTNESFHNYADYALSEPFHEGLEHLLDEGRERRCVVMCSESVWWRCHRRIVADYLIANGKSVFHIMGKGRVECAKLTIGAIIQPDATIVYPMSSSGAENND